MSVSPAGQKSTRNEQDIREMSCQGKALSQVAEMTNLALENTLEPPEVSHLNIYDINTEIHQHYT